MVITRRPTANMYYVFHSFRILGFSSCFYRRAVSAKAIQARYEREAARLPRAYASLQPPNPQAGSGLGIDQLYCGPEPAGGTDRKFSSAVRCFHTSDLNSMESPH
jgi:hypothetical protein